MGFFDKVRASFARFMSGRYGACLLYTSHRGAVLCLRQTRPFHERHSGSL